MADLLVERCSKMNLVGTEDEVVDLEEGFDDTQDEKLALRLVGCIVTEKPLNFDAVKRTLLHIWSLKEGVVIRMVGVNLFLFQFFH